MSHVSMQPCIAPKTTPKATLDNTKQKYQNKAEFADAEKTTRTFQKSSRAPAISTPIAFSTSRWPDAEEQQERIDTELRLIFLAHKMNE